MIRKILILGAIFLEQFGFSLPLFSDFSGNYQNKDFVALSEESLLDNISFTPEKIVGKDLNISAKSFIAIDYESAKILSEKDSKVKISMASLTKIMTGVLVIEKSELNKEVVVSKNAVSSYGEGVGLRSEEILTVEDLLYAALLNSSNDGCVALAEYISGSEEEFVKLMNKKAKGLNLNNTKFANSSGLDDVNHYSTANDLAILTRYALQNDKFREIVSTREKRIISVQGINHYLKNSNKLMFSGEFNVLGVKTGYTGEAGECLITLAEKNGNKILTVVLNSNDRFGETKGILQWLFEVYKWQ